MSKLQAPKGLQNSAQGFDPGNSQNKRFALTRRYLVAPCWKNTRSAGLEVLKGQQNPGLSHNLRLRYNSEIRIARALGTWP